MARILIAALLLAAAPVGAQTVHHVDVRGDCDGLAPCHDTIMAAVAAAVPGDTVSIFPGRYPESVEIVGREGLRVVGRAGTGGLVCEVAPRGERVELAAELFVDEYAALHIENLTLLGGAFFARGSGDPAPDDDSTLVGNRVFGGLFLQMCFGWTIRDNAFAGAGTGFAVEVQGDVGCRILDNSFANGGLHLLNADNSTDSEISGNVFTTGGIVIDSERVRGLRIAQNRLLAGDLVIDAREPSDNVIDGNVLDAGSLRLAGETGNGNSVVRNQVFDSDGNGIELALRALSSNSVSDNTSLGHAQCDIADLVMAGVDNDWSGNTFETACGAADG